jgi:hypothetical protein
MEVFFMLFDHTTETIEPDLTKLLTIGGQGLELPSGATEDRPTEAIPGTVRWNTDIGGLEFKNGETWSILGFTPSMFVFHEEPAGTKDGVNTTFTLVNTPYGNSEQVFLNGLYLHPGSENDYTISGSTLTMGTALASSDRLVVNYIKA